MLTVKDLLNIKAISGIKIAAGQTGINNQISIVNIIENPDVFDWLSPNELILSTGYIFKDSAELQNRVIQELAESNCAGLVVKMKRYFDKLPQNMIDLANKLGFPLLELPFQYTLSQVIAIINEKTKAGYDSLNRRSLDLHNALFKIALEGGGIEQITAELSATIHNPVVILDRDWSLLYYKEHNDATIPLEQIIPLEINKPVFDADFTDRIPNYISEIKRSIKRSYFHNGQEFKCRIMPVAVSSFVYGFIVVFQTVRKLVEFDYLALENVSTILALDRIKAREIEEIKLKIRQDLFDVLLSGNPISAKMIDTLSDMHGLKEKYAYYCLLIHMEATDIENYSNMVIHKYELEHIAKKCVQRIHELPAPDNGEVTCYYRNQQIVILVGRNENKAPLTKNEVKSYAQEIYDELHQRHRDVGFFIGVGGQYKTIHMLYKSFFEAQEVLRLQQRLKYNRIISHYEDFAVYHFLDANVNTAEMERFFQKTLGAVAEHDHLFGTSFMSTLEYYFKYNHNISEAAKAMYIHRNTFIYRIDKTKELLHSDLKDADELLQIQLALKLYRLMNRA